MRLFSILNTRYEDKQEPLSHSGSGSVESIKTQLAQYLILWGERKGVVETAYAAP